MRRQIITQARIDLAMPELTLSIRAVSDEIKHHLWSSEPFRHFEMEITVSNDDDIVTAEDVSFELLVPEDSISNLSGDAWHPIERREMEGTIYQVWQTLGGGPGLYEDTVGGVTMRPDARWPQKLAINLKPYTSTIAVLWRLLERGDPVGEYHQEQINFQPFVPAL